MTITYKLDFQWEMFEILETLKTFSLEIESMRESVQKVFDKIIIEDEKKEYETYYNSLNAGEF